MSSQTETIMEEFESHLKKALDMFTAIGAKRTETANRYIVEFNLGSHCFEVKESPNPQSIFYILTIWHATIDTPSLENPFAEQLVIPSEFSFQEVGEYLERVVKYVGKLKPFLPSAVASKDIASLSIHLKLIHNSLEKLHSLVQKQSNGEPPADIQATVKHMNEKLAWLFSHPLVQSSPSYSSPSSPPSIGFLPLTLRERSTTLFNGFTMVAFEKCIPAGYRLDRLLFDSEISGQLAVNFYRGCNNQGPTLTLMRTSAGLVGFYTPLSYEDKRECMENDGLISCICSHGSFPDKVVPYKMSLPRRSLLVRALLAKEQLRTGQSREQIYDISDLLDVFAPVYYPDAIALNAIRVYKVVSIL